MANLHSLTVALNALRAGRDAARAADSNASPAAYGKVRAALVAAEAAYDAGLDALNAAYRADASEFAEIETVAPAPTVPAYYKATDCNGLAIYWLTDRAMTVTLSECGYRPDTQYRIVAMFADPTIPGGACVWTYEYYGDIAATVAYVNERYDTNYAL